VPGDEKEKTATKHSHILIYQRGETAESFEKLHGSRCRPKRIDGTVERHQGRKTHTGGRLKKVSLTTIVYSSGWVLYG